MATDLGYVGPEQLGKMPGNCGQAEIADLRFVTSLRRKKLQLFVRFRFSAMTRGLRPWPMLMTAVTVVVLSSYR
jgi:hypothetical protein